MCCAVLCRAGNGIRGYPHLKVFRRGIGWDFKGGRARDDVVEYMLAQRGEAWTELGDLGEMEEFISAQDGRTNYALLGFFASPTPSATPTHSYSPLHYAFHFLAQQFRDEFAAAYIVSRHDLYTAFLARIQERELKTRLSKLKREETVDEKSKRDKREARERSREEAVLVVSYHTPILYRGNSSSHSRSIHIHSESFHASLLADQPEQQSSLHSQRHSTRLSIRGQAASIQDTAVGTLLSIEADSQAIRASSCAGME